MLDDDSSRRDGHDARKATSRLTTSPGPLLVDRAFTTAHGREAGLSPKAMRHPRFAIPTPGVRLPAHLATDLRARAEAALLVAPAGSALSHSTALRAHGADLPRRLDADDRVHLTVPVRAVVPRRAGIVSHTYAAPVLPVSRVDGLPVVTPEHTWLQLAGTLPPDEVVVLADALLRRKRPLSSLDALRRTVVETLRGTRGLARMRVALTLARAGTDSCMETRARLLLVHAGLPSPRVNVPVLDAQGRFVAMPDMTYLEQRIAVEYDGDVHRTDRRTWLRDIARKQALEALGWRVFVVTADDVYRHPERLVQRVRAALRERTPAR
ncbi:endonuclease domain-containing protein [Cellulosimicrobium sp. NPDC057127]|uniref:endonuclease domain-containing protein n=1 Tax=Cellulosimicrobium sp. NPDC057127 TaxID=3346026 RepID=UPI0036458497